MKVRPNKVNTLDVRGKLKFITDLKYLFIFLFFLLMPLSVFGEEKIIRVLTGQGHAPPQHIEQFEKQIQDKYQQKVKLEIIYLTGPEDWYKMIRTGKADLVLLTHHHFKDKRFNYIPNHFLLPIDLKNIPNFKHVIPALQKADYLTDEGKTLNIFFSPKADKGGNNKKKKINRYFKPVIKFNLPPKSNVFTLFGLTFIVRSCKT